MGAEGGLLGQKGGAGGVQSQGGLPMTINQQVMAVGCIISATEVFAAGS